MNTPDPRRLAFDLVADGIDGGLPVPQRIEIGDADCNRGDLTVHLGDDARDAADRWAACLGLPAPTMPDHGPIPGQGRWFQPYGARADRYPLTGRAVAVRTYVTVPAPAEAVAR
ncbi:hypothetical protein ACN28G_19805 [Micromonospora sp. WMMA1923]|uniref:hypothetical protein n=1 Tax=Micromonospora sp. WMMA1923 TaxID=3404125 RepID=UPI003B955910